MTKSADYHWKMAEKCEREEYDFKQAQKQLWCEGQVDAAYWAKDQAAKCSRKARYHAKVAVRLMAV